MEKTIYKGSIMDWTQSLTIIFSTVGFVLVLFIYLMSRMDNKFSHMDNKFEQLLNRMDSNQKENNAKFEAINGRFNGLENRITFLEAEAKNTSQRITDLKTDMNQRLSNIENCIMPRKVFHFEESHKDDHEEPKEN